MAARQRTSTRPWRLIPPEVRWFSRGTPPASPRGKVRHRIDAYHLASLSPARSVKERGVDGPLEMKVRVGTVRACTVGGVAGVAEQWRKRVIPGRREELHHASWIKVDKTIWSDRGLQFAVVHIGDEEWWSMVMPDEKQVTKPVATWMLDHAEALAEAMSCSFPSLLLHREAIRETGEAS